MAGIWGWQALAYPYCNHKQPCLGLRGLSSLCWAVTLEQVYFPTKFRQTLWQWGCVTALCVGDLIVIFSCHNGASVIGYCTLCLMCTFLNYFNSNVCVFELFRFGRELNNNEFLLLHLEMLKALFSPCHVAHELHMCLRHSHSVLCGLKVHLNYKLYFRVLRKLCESKDSFQYALHKCGCLLQNTGNGVWLFCLAHLSISVRILVAEASSTL